MTGTVQQDLLAVVRRGLPTWQETVTHIEELPARVGVTADWPTWVPPDLRSALAGRGIKRPWTHQATAADLAWNGHHVVLATGTASGKSLGFLLPVLSRMLTDPRATALYLSPTKALGADQLAAVTDLGLVGVRAASYDGDTPIDERDWVRDHGRFVFTNPDMLHRGMLPRHDRWARMLRRLQFVVIDECHSYRGIFGSQVALTLRRLRRIALRYGTDPVFVLASATVADPETAAGRLIGAPVAGVTHDDAPRAARRFVLWQPPLVHAGDEAYSDDAADGPTVDQFADREPDIGAGQPEPDRGVVPAARRSAPAEAARMLADLVGAGARTLAFVRSRQGAEQVALTAKRRLQRTDPMLADRVAAYRGGFLPEHRRALERSLNSGELLGVATTNALELGIDISGLDAAVLAGYPGTLASIWQQAGRAGRQSEPDSPGRPEALVVFVARDDPLDNYLIRHPAAVFGAPMEAAVIDPANPRLLGPQLRCAAAELRLTEADLPLFGDPDAVRLVLADLVRRKLLRHRSAGWYHVLPRHPADEIDLRGGGAEQIAIVEESTGQLLGTVDAGRAPGAVHEGAVHLHRGETYVVDELDLESGVALVHAERPDWTTMPRSTGTVEILGTDAERRLPGGVSLGLGPVRVTEQVVGYQRRRPRGHLLDVIPLDLPEHRLDTRAVRWTIEAEALLAAGLPEESWPGALHAAEHAAIGMLPLFAGCDRSDIGGRSTALHPDTGLPTILVHDGYAGGAGFADRGYAVATDWLTATRETISSCHCRSGCPSCVQSPKCGNGNHPLFKDGAVVVLDLVITALTAAAPPEWRPDTSGPLRRM